MWLFTMFDLPVDDKAARKEYARFRKILLRHGFTMLQYSVYARYCPSEEAADAYRNHVAAAVPPHGQVRLVSITDRQFGKMQVFFGKKRQPVEDPPMQMVLF
jgi:CRISPR-associated protein Cas2